MKWPIIISFSGVGDASEGAWAMRVVRSFVTDHPERRDRDPVAYTSGDTTAWVYWSASKPSKAGRTGHPRRLTVRVERRRER